MRPDKFNFDEWQVHLDDTLNKQFPKGRCKQRGNALVLYSEFQIFLSALMKDIGGDFDEIKKCVECTKDDGGKE